MPQIAIYIEGARQVLEISDTRLAAALERALDRLALWDGDTDPPGYRLPTGEPQASVGTAGTVTVTRDVAALIDVFLPINPNKLRHAADVKEAVLAFRKAAGLPTRRYDPCEAGERPGTAEPASTPA